MVASESTCIFSKAGHWVLVWVRVFACICYLLFTKFEIKRQHYSIWISFPNIISFDIVCTHWAGSWQSAKTKQWIFFCNKICHLICSVNNNYSNKVKNSSATSQVSERLTHIIITANVFYGFPIENVWGNFPVTITKLSNIQIKIWKFLQWVK